MDRRGLLIGAGLTALAGVSYWRAPTTAREPLTPTQFRAAMPRAVGPWSSRASGELVMPPRDDSSKLYENLETRVFEGDGLPAIMVLVAYSSIQQNDIQIHRPEICYPASGYPIIASQPANLQFDTRIVHATELVADRQGMLERIIYWVRVGEDFPINWADQRIAMAKANLQGSVPDGVLFRVSTLERPGEYMSETLNHFIQLFLEQATPLMRETILL